MRKSIRLVAILAFFAISASLHSFGSSVLCQSLPTAVTTGNTLAILFQCAVPANAVPTGKSLRLTANLHAVNSGTHGVTSWVAVNGSTFAPDSTPAQLAEQNWSLLITNIGGTRASIGGTSTANTNTGAWGPGNVGTVTFPWSSGFQLQILVDFGSGGTFTADGDSFLVEIID